MKLILSPLFKNILQPSSAKKARDLVTIKQSQSLQKKKIAYRNTRYYAPKQSNTTF
jgi:hypothetical protein